MEKYRIIKHYSANNNEYIYIPQKRWLFLFWSIFHMEWDHFNKKKQQDNQRRYFGYVHDNFYSAYFYSESQAFEYIKSYENNLIKKNIKNKNEVISYSKLLKRNNVS